MTVQSPPDRDIQLDRAPRRALRIVQDIVNARVHTPSVESLAASAGAPSSTDSAAVSQIQAERIAPAFPAGGPDAVLASQPRPTATSGGLPDNSAVTLPPAQPAVRAFDPSVSLPANSSVAPMPIEPPPAPAAPTRIGDERLVLETLRRYEQAYDQLDAVAARQVWPTVDTNALARAFSGLTEQDVSLGRCNVEVAGGSARADCTGTVRWTPRIGGGPHSQSRRWSFQLTSGDEGWTIVSATVR